MDFWEILEAIDKNVFSFIHVEASTPALDGFMKMLRNAATWVPLYAFMVYWIIRFQRKYAWQFILLTVVSFAVTDFVSASIIKPFVGRIRPCYEPDLQSIIRGVVGCGGQYSFPSSHAANHFGLATFWFLTIQRMAGRKWFVLWLWALAVCYAQIYVGKHYPLDIVGGALLGMIVGALCARIFDRWLFPERRKNAYQPIPELS